MFLGSSIHDVAQAVGAGFAVSTETGQVATLVKLGRVALLPLVTTIVLVVRWRRGPHAQGTRPVLPWFLFAFVACVAVRNGIGPEAAVLEGAQSLSKGLMAIAIAAICMKTQPQAMIAVGAEPVVLLALTTAALAAGYLLALGLP